MPARAFWQFVWIALLLVAQHGALTHAIWHAHEYLPAHTQESGYESQSSGDRGGGPQSPQSELCGFDLAFGQVLGGVHGACQHFVAPGLAAERPVQPLHARWAAAPIFFYSRGPPASL